MKKLIMVSCILSMCCLLVKAEVKEIAKFSKSVDELSLYVDTFLEYAPKVDKVFGTVEKFKINTSSSRKSINYDGMNIKTKEDFEKLYDFLQKLEAKGDLKLDEAISLKLIKINVKSATNRLMSSFGYLISVSASLKKEYPNYSSRKTASNKLKAVLEKFLKAGGVKLSPNEKRNLMKSF